MSGTDTTGGYYEIVLLGHTTGGLDARLSALWPISVLESLHLILVIGNHLYPLARLSAS